MAEHGFFHPDFGYWQTVSTPSEQSLAEHPEGTIEVPLRPSPDHVWEAGVWVYVTPVPPTPEENRANMQPLTARQFRLGLLQSGRTLAQVEAAIAAIEDPTERETAQVDWEYASEFNRMHPLVVDISLALGLSPEQVDTLWLIAVEL
ncbi:hypothetical protein [Roseibium sp.]|uniref:hypothetical protein n=1 Tax=Roseibium sp. TaxID=1936156 RepID=UPI003BA90D78